MHMYIHVLWYTVAQKIKKSPGQINQFHKKKFMQFAISRKTKLIYLISRVIFPPGQLRTYSGSALLHSR